MNANVLESRWRQMRGELRSWWGKLTDDDLEQIAGRKDRLVGMLQQKYGYTREAAQQEIDRRLREYDERMGASGPGKAAQPISTVGEKIGSLAGVIREKAPHEGAIGTAATTVAEKLDTAGSYLQTKDFDHMVGDLSGVIRRYPIPSLLIGLGIGYLLARSTRRY
jgi:uncharacterized protein YjbJ (UPF0337 family)